MDEIELTELTDLEVIRQDAVGTPASGFPFLIMKSAAAKDVNAVGGLDEKPDIAGADRVLAELYRLIEAEAREGAVGAHEDADIHILAEAISLIRCFRENEMWGDEDDGSELAKSADGLVFKAHRKFSSDERKSLASEGKALPDGSYPIPDEDALRRAAILARSGHGDVAAAKRLIAKRARELGVRNPLSEDTKKEAPEGATPETSDVVTKDAVQEMIKEALEAEVSKAVESATKALTDELAVLKATPIPGQVSMTAPPAARETREHNDNLAKAAYHERQASIVGPRDLIEYHTRKAAEYKSAATA